jgi:REase_DpnII-MboI
MPASPAAAAKPVVAPPAFSTTQEVRVPTHSVVPSTASPSATPPLNAVSADVDYLSVTMNLCQRFHAVARQLRLRGEYRSTICVEDEIDVQDLIHALLRQHFEDIGTDEWTPAYGDGGRRTTFLLDHDRLAIVVKKTRAGLSRKELTEQVRADVERYRARGRCSQLVCFIYDPEGRIGNPRGLENELASNTEHFTVDVIVAPK